MDIKHIAAQVTTKVSKNSPTILTLMGVVGVMSTSVLAVLATPKVIRLIEYEEKKRIHENNRDKLNTLDYVRIGWKEYIPAVLMGSATISCIIGANSISLRRMAIVQGVYSLTQTAFKEYQGKVVKLIGEKKEQAVRDEIAEDKLKQNPVANNTVYLTSGGNTLCYDSLSGRYFRGDIEKIRKVENQINKLLRTEMWISLNELYSEMKLEPIDMGEAIGWDVDEMMEIIFSSKLTDNDEPCLVLTHRVLPKPYSSF